MEELLTQIVDELRALNAKMDILIDVAPLSRPLYDIDDIHKQISDSADLITGPTFYNLGDLHSKLDDVISSITSLETVIDLK